jgi:hypothetical protein
MTRGAMRGASMLIVCAIQSCSDQAVNSGASPDGSSTTIQVTYLTQSVSVSLPALTTIEYKGVQVVRASDVWIASQIQADRNSLEFEFVADDGFKPSIKGACPDLPGAILDKGYFDPTTRKLSWDTSLGLGGCYGVRGAAQMNAHAPVNLDGGTTDALTGE